jgi:RNA polymerase sigma factor (sigma-70 family)
LTRRKARSEIINQKVMSPSEIITRIRHEGQHQLGLLYQEYRSEFLHWVEKEFNCSSDDSKDIYQATILVFYDNIQSGKLEHLTSSVKTYLFGIGKNIAMENIRRAKRSTPLPHSQWSMEYLQEEHDYSNDEMVCEGIRRAMNRMSESSKRLLQLFYYERKSMKEISVILNYRNSDTAKNQKCKHMAQLRKLVEEELSRLSQIY